MPHATGVPTAGSARVSPPVAAIRVIIQRVVEILGAKPYEWMEWEDFLSEWVVRSGEQFPGTGLGSDLVFLDGLRQSSTVLTYWTDYGRLLIRLDPDLIATVETGGLEGAEPSTP